MKVVGGGCGEDDRGIAEELRGAFRPVRGDEFSALTTKSAEEGVATGEGVDPGRAGRMSSYRGAYSQGGLTARPGSFGVGGATSTSAGDVQLQMPPDFDVDDEVDKLHGKVSMLKQMTGAIREETSIRGKLIDQLEETMANAGAMMKETKKKDRKSTRLNSSHSQQSRMPSSA